MSLPAAEPADVRKLTREFAKKPGVELRQEQANVLQTLRDVGGVFAPMPVGSGKTLPSLLAATAVNAKSAVLIVPAKLRQKTKDDFAALLPDWRVRLPTILSYEELGRVSREHELDNLKPDLLILDEAHAARNLRAACTKRIRRFIEENNGLKVLVLSGTIMTTSYLDYHHLSVWSLGVHSPTPILRTDAEKWSLSLDKCVPIFNRSEAPDLSALGDYHEFFRTRRGVVRGKSSTGCDASLVMAPWCPKYPKALADVIDDVVLTKLRPDGEPLDDYDLARCQAELALGFFNRWDPLPPDWWLRPRRAYNAFVREVLEEFRPGLDSDYQVALAIDNGRLPAGERLREAWLAVKNEFIPNPVPVWLTDEILLQAIKHANKQPTLVWNKFRAAGERLQELGLPYFGSDTAPERESNKSSIALSIAAHGTGKNLQAWHNNLVLHLPGNPEAWEQLIGRTHRAGQKSDEVSVDYISTLDYHHKTMARVRMAARTTRNISGFEQKILLATWPK